MQLLRYYIILCTCCKGVSSKSFQYCKKPKCFFFVNVMLLFEGHWVAWFFTLLNKNEFMLFCLTGWKVMSLGVLRSLLFLSFQNTLEFSQIQNFKTRHFLSMLLLCINIGYQIKFPHLPWYILFISELLHLLHNIP